MKYHVGDKVRIIDSWSKGDDSQNHQGMMDKWLGKVMTINEVDFEEHCYYMKEDAGELRHGKLNGWKWREALIECRVEEENGMFNKNNLCSGDILEFETGKRELIMLNTTFGDMRLPLRTSGNREEDTYNLLSQLDATNLTNLCGEKVVKIYRPVNRNYVGCTAPSTVNSTKYELIWERKPEVKELTVAEISKLLGYEVKVVK